AARSGAKSLSKARSRVESVAATVAPAITSLSSATDTLGPSSLAFVTMKPPPTYAPMPTQRSSQRISTTDGRTTRTPAAVAAETDSIVGRTADDRAGAGQSLVRTFQPRSTMSAGT